MTKRSIKVRLEDGLDARPVALLVQEAISGSMPRALWA